ncbi:MAG: radical SAM protein [candidate division KSB1 bacterium]|nr:radical SAM protein [candidate division KSB1 bacterium]MDZ7378308.1 radical SAM protein [candidate division KSB1 bacterium]MDZ7391303.1 radical SAM protein [candidate division KSB1 bacterium]MDZ7413443.1 radical SAM protein [candidate division KSB1 bacterium]
MRSWRHAPVLCLYYVTYRCNAGCRYCDIWRRPELRAVPDAEPVQVLTNLRGLKKAGVRFVDFTGGEPLLYEPLPRVLREAKTLGLYTTVTTNTILYAQRAHELRRLVDFLHFSLDTTDAAKQQRWRRSPEPSHVLAAVELAKSLGEAPDLLFTATQHSYLELPKLAELAARLRCELIVNQVFAAPPGLALTREGLAFLDRFRSHPFVYLNRGFQRLRREGGNQQKAPRCRAVSATVVISPDNAVLLPCFHRACTRLPIAGDVRAALSSPERLRHMRMQGRHPFCQGCDINCYFDPSFLYRLDGFFVDSQFSKLRYGWDKYVRARAPFPRRQLRRGD